VIATPGEQSADSTKLIARDGVLDRETVLQARDPNAGLRKVQIGSPQRDGFRDAQAVALHHQDKQVVAYAVPSSFGSGE
jgi:hypothetical protein